MNEQDERGALLTDYIELSQGDVDGLNDWAIRAYDFINRAASTPANVAQGAVAVREQIARALHYPACWDTAAYPTLDSAAWEAIACAKLKCSACAAPPAQTALTDDARDAARWRIVEQTIPADDLHDIAVIVAHEAGAFVGNAFLRTPADLIDAALTAAQSASGETK